jgi:hypothetical protein
MECNVGVACIPALSASATTQVTLAARAESRIAYCEAQGRKYDRVQWT